MAFGDVIQSDGVDNSTSIQLAGVVAGNSILVFHFQNFGSTVPSASDDVNSGSYTNVFDYGTGISRTLACLLFSNSAAGTVNITASTTAQRLVALEIEGALGTTTVGTGNSSGSDTNTVTMASDTIPSGAVAFGAIDTGKVFSDLTPTDTLWVQQLDHQSLETFKWTGTPPASTDLSGTKDDTAEPYTAGWAAFSENIPTPSMRKGGTEEFDKPAGIGTITGVTLNGNAITLDSQDASTFTVTDSGSGITTSGEYDLVATGDTVETISVQVNVYGIVPSNNPLRLQGTAQGDLTSVQIRVTDGASLDDSVGTQLYYTGAGTTDANGNLSNIDLNSTSVVADDLVEMHIKTASGESIIATETVGAI